MNLLFGGTPEDKIRCAFDFYDTSGDQRLQFDELLHYFTCTFNMVLHNKEYLQEKDRNWSVERYAMATAVKCFKECNQPIEGGAISYDEFKMWYKS
jgi:Ca2+-binding EF-hand superfamily protein